MASQSTSSYSIQERREILNFIDPKQNKSFFQQSKWSRAHRNETNIRLWEIETNLKLYPGILKPNEKTYVCRFGRNGKCNKSPCPYIDSYIFSSYVNGARSTIPPFQAPVKEAEQKPVESKQSEESVLPIASPTSFGSIESDPSEAENGEVAAYSCFRSLGLGDVDHIDDSEVTAKHCFASLDL